MLRKVLSVVLIVSLCAGLTIPVFAKTVTTDFFTISDVVKEVKLTFEDENYSKHFIFVKQGTLLEIIAPFPKGMTVEDYWDLEFEESFFTGDYNSDGSITYYLSGWGTSFSDPVMESINPKKGDKITLELGKCYSYAIMDDNIGLPMLDVYIFVVDEATAKKISTKTTTLVEWGDILTVSINSEPIINEFIEEIDTRPMGSGGQIKRFTNLTLDKGTVITVKAQTEEYEDDIEVRFIPSGVAEGDWDNYETIMVYMGEFYVGDETVSYVLNTSGTLEIYYLAGRHGHIFNITLAESSAPSSWAVEQVSNAITAGLVPQSLQSNYTQAITRAEFCSLAVALYEIGMSDDVNSRYEIKVGENIAFTDTDDINILKAATIGVVSGVGNNRFDPNAKLTREQAVTMLARLYLSFFAGTMVDSNEFLNQMAGDLNFADSDNIADWAKGSASYMSGLGIMSGTGNNMFSPKDPYTREQSIVTIMRLFNALGN